MSKRSGSGSKQPKEKIVYIYELLLRGEDVVKGNTNFWDEFFLLQPTTSSLDVLELEIQKTLDDDFKNCIAKANIILLFKKCIKMLDSDNRKRINNSLITLSSITFALFRKYSTREATESFLESLVTEAEVEIKYLVDKIKFLLSEQNNDSNCSKYHCLKFLFVIVTGINDLCQNLLMEFIMAANNLFDPLKKMLGDSTQRLQHGHDIVILLTLLVNYRKSDGTNPYAVQLSLLDDEFALHGFGQIISSTLFEFIRLQSTSETPPNNSWISSFSSMVGNIFLTDEIDGRTQDIRQNTILLLALYEAVHLNRNFITTLATTHAETSTAQATCDSLSNRDEFQTVPMLEATQYPTNLFVAVFQFCSVVMADHKNENSLTNLKLCFIVLTCISEDQYANSMMHDPNLTFQVYLYKAQMRHRKITSDRPYKPQPLAATLLDLLTEFIVTHLLKKFPLEHYLLCIGIIHRIIIYQKRCRIRLIYPWKVVWTAIISMLKFIMCQEQQLVKKMNIFNLLAKVINIFNLFITYGDTFLATTSCYDELYYELNREEKIFSEIQAMAMRYTSMESNEYKDDAFKVTNSLVNILAIIKHFQIKIKEFLTVESLSTPTEDQIMKQIQNNYDLTLKLQDSLDTFERYTEKPHGLFFNSLVKDIILDTRRVVHCDLIKLCKRNRINVNM